MKYILIIFIILFFYSCQQDGETILISFKVDLPTYTLEEIEKATTYLKNDDFDRLKNSQLIIEVFPQVDNPKNSLKFDIATSECITLNEKTKELKIDCLLEVDIYNNSQIYTYIKDKRGIYLAARNYITVEEGKEDDIQEKLLKFRKIMRFKIEDMENLSVIGYTPFDERIKNDKKRFFVRKAKESKIKDSFLFPVSIRKEVFSDRFNIFFEVKKGDKKGIILPFKILTAEQDKATDITVDNQDITEEASCFRNGENGETGCGREEECASLNAEDMTNNAEDVSNNLDDKCFENQIGTNLMELDRGSYQLNLKYYNKKEIELEENKANLDKIKVSSITITNKYFKPQVGDIYENTTLGSFFLTGYNFNLLSKSDNNKIVRGEIKISYGEIGIYKDVFLSYKGTFILYPLKNAEGVAGWVLQNRFPFYKLCGNYDRGIRECIPYAEEPTFLQEDPKSIKFIEFNGNKIIELYNSRR